MHRLHNIHFDRKLQRSLSVGLLGVVLLISVFAGIHAQQSSHAAACTTAPAAPSNLAQGLSSTTSYTSGAFGSGGYGGGILTNLPNAMMLVWSPSVSSDSCTPTGYHIYRNGTIVGSTAGTTYTDQGLNPSTTYAYSVTAYDTAGDQSASSNTFSGTTAGGSSTMVGDANGDGRVNAIDLSILISHDGQNYPAADFNGDGTVGAADLAILLAKWTW